MPLEHLGDAFGHGRARQYGVHCYSRAGHALGETARDSDVGGLADAVVDHLDGYIEGGFRTEEDEAPPRLGSHFRKVGARQAYACHDVDLPMAVPDRIVGLEEIQRLKDAEIADDDVRLGFGPDHRVAPLGAGEVERMTARRAAEARHRRIDLLLAAAVDNYRCARLMEGAGNGKSDAFGGSCNQRDFT
jgi:hypothetical protein